MASRNKQKGPHFIWIYIHVLLRSGIVPSHEYKTSIKRDRLRTGGAEQGSATGKPHDAKVPGMMWVWLLRERRGYCKNCVTSKPIKHIQNDIFVGFPPGLILDILSYGYGSIPINTIFSGMNIHKSQLFWGSLGTRVLTHPHISNTLKAGTLV